MNILIIDHYAGSRSLGMEFRPYYLARQWQRMGHIVTIAAADYSHLRAVNVASSGRAQSKRVDGVDYIFLRTPEYTGNGLGRARNIAAFLSGLWRLSRRIASGFCPDVVIASSTYPMDIWPARHIAKMCGAKLVWEIHDIYPDSLCLHHFPGIIRRMAAAAMNAAVDFACGKSDLIVSVLSHARLFLEGRKLGAEAVKKLVYIPNGAEAGDISGQGEPSAYCRALITAIEKLRADGKFVVMYLGGFAAANALDEFVWASRLVKNAAFVLVGNGLDRARLKRLAEREGISRENRIFFFDAVEKDDVQELLTHADCLYAGLRRSELYRFGVGMNKLYDYMLSARPVICGMDAPFNVIEEGGCGLVIPPEDSAAIAEAVMRLADMPQTARDRMGLRGREYVLANNSWSVLARRFLDALGERSEPEQ